MVIICPLPKSRVNLANILVRLFLSVPTAVFHYVVLSIGQSGRSCIASYNAWKAVLKVKASAFQLTRWYAWSKGLTSRKDKRIGSGTSIRIRWNELVASATIHASGVLSSFDQRVDMAPKETNDLSRWKIGQAATLCNFAQIWYLLWSDLCRFFFFI